MTKAKYFCPQIDLNSVERFAFSKKAKLTRKSLKLDVCEILLNSGVPEIAGTAELLLFGSNSKGGLKRIDTVRKALQKALVVLLPAQYAFDDNGGRFQRVRTRTAKSSRS